LISWNAEREVLTMFDHEAMLAIQQELDGVEWTADTLERIAEILHQAGYRIRGPGSPRH
jgi:hypothetical protein